MAYVVFHRYEPAKACQVILACIVLHNIAVSLRLPVPDDDDDDDNNSDDDNNDDGDDNDGDPSLQGRATRDRLAQRYFR